jgi:hypothetical protein
LSRPRAPSERGAEKRSPRRTVVLVFGEDDNDRESIRILLGALRPDLAERIQTRRHPLVLIKSANLEDVPDRAQQIAKVVAIERVKNDVGCVFAHEDCDEVEPAHDKVAAKIESALKSAGCDAHAVTPAWEMEAWWFLFPDAVQAASPSWRRPDDHVGKHVGKIRNAKEELKRRVKPPGAKPGFRGYQESDAPKIAAQVCALGLAEKPQATSDSYARFRESARACLRSSAPVSPAPAVPSAREPSRRMPRTARRG